MATRSMTALILNGKIGRDDDKDMVWNIDAEIKLPGLRIYSSPRTS